MHGLSGRVRDRGQHRRLRPRTHFIRELLRVVRPGGVLYLDFPNGAFPIDFWHGTVPGGARWHSLSEGFLPKVREIRGYLREIGDYEATPMSPRTRLRMRQVGQHWWGRLLRLPMTSLLWLMEVPGFRWLAASGLNPYLVLRVERRERLPQHDLIGTVVADGDLTEPTVPAEDWDAVRGEGA